MNRRPPARGAGLRPLGELRRQRGEKPRRHTRRPAEPAAASRRAPSLQGTPGPGTPRTRRRRRRRSPDRAGEARGDPPPPHTHTAASQSKQGLDSRRALTGSRGPAAAEPRPARSGQAGPEESDWSVAAAEAAGGRGSGPRCFHRRSRPRSSGSVLRSRVTSGRGSVRGREANRLLTNA